MHDRLPTLCTLLTLFALAPATPAGQYIDPAQLDVPWPKHSHYRQPCGAYLETKSGDDFLSGIGVNYHSPGNDELAIRLLAESGFHTIRVEIGWGSVRWDETGLNDQARYEKIFKLLKQYNIRPTILLNAHQGVPCPVKFFTRKLAADAPKGSRSVAFSDTKDLVPGYSGLSQLSEYWAAQALILNIDASTGQCQLSKPLPKDLKAGDTIPLATLKYLPLYPVGTPQFDQTADGWTRYALLACKLAADAGIQQFDIEIWNELTFGTRFLTISNYYEHTPAPDEPRGGFLHEGGRCWELARRTINSVKAKYPAARCIWGFSNTTFFHTPVPKLPPRTDGQSYHPYGTGLRSLPKDEPHKDHPEFCLEGFTPTMDIRMPEGFGPLFLKTESLIRLINPQARQAHPQGTQRFFHYMTEHGVVPGECGISDDAGCWNLKTRCALRSFCLYLNKGIDVLDYFQACDNKPQGMGLLPPDVKKLPADAKFNDVATPPMRALRHLTAAFAGSVPLPHTSALHVQLQPAGPIASVFNDGRHPPLMDSDVFAFLPFQVNAGKFVIAVYVMTYDATKPFAEERYDLAIAGLPAGLTRAALYDPVTDKTQPLTPASDGSTTRLQVQVTDYPRLLILQ